jgi:membrane-associated phospholipid phosphatase
VSFPRKRESRILMMKLKIFIACIIIIKVNILSQDTINFKQYDSLKTSAEDRHISSVNFPKDTSQIGVTSIRKSITKDTNTIDVKLFRTINNNRSPFKDAFFDVFDRSMLPVAVILPPAMFIYSRKEHKYYDENTAYLTFGAELTNAILTFGTKIFVNRKRPLERLPNVYCKGMPALDVYSFPSGHTSTTFTMATMFTLRYPKYPQVYVPMYIYSLIVAYGRPYFGMHYPSDLLAGALYGTGSAILVFSLRKELLKMKNNLLGEDKPDEGSLNGGAVSFFAGSFAASALVNLFFFKDGPTRRLYVSPWMDGKRGGLNFNVKF